MKVVSKYFMIFVALLGLGVLTGCDWVKDGENRPSSVQTDGTTGQVSIVSEIEKNIETLVLTVEATTLNKDANSSVSVKAVMKDGSTQELTDGLEWEIMPKYAVTVAKGILIAREDVPVKIKAKIGSVESNSVDLNITWTMNGYVLPPEPDKALNDSTLLGIDINDNGVRDDVERYIYERFGEDPEYPKTKTALAMQDAWATQKILKNPTIESKKYLDDAIDCQYYWFDKKTQGLSGYEFIQYSIKHKVFDDINLKDKMLNTKQRILRVFKFNEACSGHIFRGRGKESIENCQTNIDILGE